MKILKPCYNRDTYLFVKKGDIVEYVVAGCVLRAEIIDCVRSNILYVKARTINGHESMRHAHPLAVDRILKVVRSADHAIR